jgi:hypothetical protein
LRGWKLGRTLFVAAAGGSGSPYWRCRGGAIAEVKTEVLSRPGRYRTIEENLLAKEGVVGDGGRRRRSIVCFNPKEAECQAQHRAEVVEALQEELARHQTRAATAQWEMELLTSGRYRRYLKVTEGGEVHLDTEAIRQPPASTASGYSLPTTIP